MAAESPEWELELLKGLNKGHIHPRNRVCWRLHKKPAKFPFHLLHNHDVMLEGKSESWSLTSGPR